MYITRLRPAVDWLSMFYYLSVMARKFSVSLLLVNMRAPLISNNFLNVIFIVIVLGVNGL